LSNLTICMHCCCCRFPAVLLHQVCDCISGLGLKDGSISIDLPLGASVTFIPPKFPTLPQYPW
jgi:hypothetical protein